MLQAPTLEKPGKPREYITREARSVLVLAVLDYLPARDVQARLRQRGVIRKERAVMLWLHETRVWLGLDHAYPRYSVPKYRELVEDFIARNGRPSLQDLDAGWLPVHPRTASAPRPSPQTKPS